MTAENIIKHIKIATAPTSCRDMSESNNLKLSGCYTLRSDDTALLEKVTLCLTRNENDKEHRYDLHASEGTCNTLNAAVSMKPIYKHKTCALLSWEAPVHVSSTRKMCEPALMAVDAELIRVLTSSRHAIADYSNDDRRVLYLMSK